MELKFYKQPFTNVYGRVYDVDNNFVFQFQVSDETLQRKIIDILNDTVKDIKYIIANTLSISKKDGDLILASNKPFILIRGWGNLTGTGAHHLKPDVAAKIQDDFRDWIIFKLTTT